MDIKPENINPDIVEVGKNNPAVKEIFIMYLCGLPINDGEPLTWRQTLEMMVLKLANQYSGALEGWKDATKFNPTPDGTLLLVNESEVEVESPEKVQLEVAKGMLAKLISPLRRAWHAEGGQSEDFPPIQLTKSFVEQAEKLIGTGNVDKYVSQGSCPVCGANAWIIEDGVSKCAPCESAKAKRSHQFKKEQVVLAVRELIDRNPNIAINERLKKALPELRLD